MLSPVELSIRDNYSLIYNPYLFGTLFYILPAELSIRDNYIKLKYIPYPFGTVFNALPCGGFNLR